MTESPPAPFVLQTIAFGFPGNPGAIPLRDPATLAFLGDQPEWDAAGRNVPAAFVRETQPAIRVRFAQPAGGASDPGKVWRISARGHRGPGVAEREVSLGFDASGQSTPIDFSLDGPLPASLGKVSLKWSWRASNGAREFELDTTRHDLLLSWKPAIAPASWLTQQEPGDPPAGQPGAAWTYLPIMQWTCAAAEGRNSEEEICDAIFSRLPETGLQYAIGAWNVYDMLQKGGGYCGGWFRMFQAMAGAHGVMLERRFIAVDWRVESPAEQRWCAIVVAAPGLNRKKPAEHASTFHDVDERPVSTSAIERVRQRRYRFWGVPGRVFDGHCVNFLRSGDRWILYDASFLIRAELQDFSLPASNPKHSLPVDGLGSFKEAYLDVAVNFMLGTLEHEGRLFRTEHPDPKSPDYRNGTTRNGLTMETGLLPKGDGVITFYWL